MVNHLSFRRHLNLQAKISLVLVAVILPTFLIVTIAENKLTLPILEEEIRQVGIHTGKTLAAQIISSRMLSLSNPTPVIENALQELLYAQPDIVRIDVFIKDYSTGVIKLVASNIEDDPSLPLQTYLWVDAVTSEYRLDEGGMGFWEILVPIEQRVRESRGGKKLLGNVHVVVSTKLVGHLLSALWKTTASAAAFSVVSLIWALSYFLKKTIENDRLLRQAESMNIQLTEQLDDAQRKLMMSEKLAVMGQLTASFAHEIGTPLNAIGGHLQLLQEEMVPQLGSGFEERLGIVNGQLGKIEKIVKSFLQNTEKPNFQKQLIDLNQLIDKTLRIVAPRMDSLGVKLKCKYDGKMGPMRAVPLDIEQVLLNLINNSLDSMKGKSETKERGKNELEIKTRLFKNQGTQWVEVSVYDTGEGIHKVDLKNVLKPFFTTKAPGEGTGLGLTICQEIAHKYGGDLSIDSKEGAWTRVVLTLPCHAKT